MVVVVVLERVGEGLLSLVFGRARKIVVFEFERVGAGRLSLVVGKARDAAAA